ncbi:MAG: GntR family transcriptional regulator [Candidatus Hydrogenedentes bacterium]|nr:GntR family transcriptional regulator [Candidatus Hydrogenedentota bacterium]
MSNPPFKFSINIDGSMPVYVQIENLVQYAIASGHYGPGDTLPSVREMSETLGINPNTVTKSYRDLELMKMVRSRRGVGVMVTDEAPAICIRDARLKAEYSLRDSVAECVVSGIKVADVRRIVKEAIESGETPYLVR